MVERIEKRIILEARKLLESMSRFCTIYKATDGQWYLDLADKEYGTEEDAITYGPFCSKDAAEKHLDNFSNPGAIFFDDSGTTELPDGHKIVNPFPVRSRLGIRRGYGVGRRF